MKQFECFWGDGYRGDDGKSILEYHDLHFFNEDRGYSFIDSTKISTLQIGEYAQFQESGDHWVRRVS